MNKACKKTWLKQTRICELSFMEVFKHKNKPQLSKIYNSLSLCMILEFCLFTKLWMYQ